MKKHVATLCAICGIGFSVQITAQDVIPEMVNNKLYKLSCANTEFSIDASIGARISAYKVDGENVTVPTAGASSMTGSTFWPSPQSVWGWPPAPALDNQPYKAFIAEKKIIMVGNKDKSSGLRFRKIFYATTADTAITIEYIMINENTVSKSWAPWEVTRVPAQGMAFFPKGEGSVTGNMAGNTEEINNYIWYDQELTNATNSENKFFADGKGWLAQLNNKNQLFIKAFENIDASTSAPGETEVEMYTAPDNSYTELENQGKYTAIKPGDSVVWKVRWFVRSLPVNIDHSKGSAALTSYVENILAHQANKIHTAQTTRSFSASYLKNEDALQICGANIAETGACRVHIMDIDGRTLVTSSLQSNTTKIDLSKVAAGCLFYSIVSNNNVIQNGKLIKY